MLSGFDRLVFRGTIRQLSHLERIRAYLSVRSIPLKDFGVHSQGMTQLSKDGVTTAVQEWGRPVIYLPSSTVRKE